MKVISAIKQLLGLSAVTKSEGGFLVALVGLITIVGRETIVHVGVLNSNQAIVCIVLGVVGFLTWLIGRLSEGGPGQPDQGPDAPADLVAAENPVAFFKCPKCWGLMLILAAAVLSYLTEAHEAPVPALIVQARPKPKVMITVTHEVPITNEVHRVSFPRLALQGIVINGGKSSAIINGQVLCLGEHLGDVALVAVEPLYVTVELEGQTKWLVLPK